MKSMFEVEAYSDNRLIQKLTLCDWIAEDHFCQKEKKKTKEGTKSQ